MCTLRFDIPNNIGPPVLFYYRLTNFYQNHRRYVKSLDTQQLMGNAQSNASIAASDCDPLQVDEATGKAYYPCGLIANSLFNDTFTSPNLTNPSAGAEPTYNMSQRGIAWDSDKELYKETEYTIDQVVPPRNWKQRYPNGYTETEPLPDLHNDEAFQVWMRTAGLPTFSKLAMRNDTASMPIGRYQLSIYDRRAALRPLIINALMVYYRLQRDVVWRDKVNFDIYKNRHGRQEPVPWHRLCCRWGHLHPPRCYLYSNPSHQAKVYPYFCSEQSLLVHDS